MRNFGLTSPRGGHTTQHIGHRASGTAPAGGSGAISYLPPLPAGSIARGSVFKRSEFTQALIDVGAIGFWILFICSAAVAVGASIFLLFCRF